MGQHPEAIRSFGSRCPPSAKLLGSSPHPDHASTLFDQLAARQYSEELHRSNEAVIPKPVKRRGYGSPVIRRTQKRAAGAQACRPAPRSVIVMPRPRLEQRVPIPSSGSSGHIGITAAVARGTKHPAAASYS